jgi:hypothetical protein
MKLNPCLAGAMAVNIVIRFVESGHRSTTALGEIHNTAKSAGNAEKEMRVEAN